MNARSGNISREQGSASSALALIAMAFTFIQDDLLDTEGFIGTAKERGHQLTLDDLQTLHNNRLLLPLYRISDMPVIGRRIKVVPNGNLDHRYRAMQAAAEGRLRDSADEGYSAAWPYRRPAGDQGEGWWNGFLYSSWQLLDLHLVVNDLAWLRRRQLDAAVRRDVVQRRRERVLALAALTPRYLPRLLGPGILGQFKVPPGIDEHELENFLFEPDVLGLLKAVAFDPERLKDEAENLLLNAHAQDPLAKWLPLIQHMSYSAWARLRDAPLHFQWLRIGAEILLRAHEDLAAAGELQSLPDLNGMRAWHPLHDRLGRTDPYAGPLEQILGSFGLSPHPRVLLLVEGETELVHLPRLLSELGLDQPEWVRVQRLKGTRVSPQLLARYAVTPRIGRELGGGRQLTATPTALVITADPEGKWAPENRNKEREKIQAAIREEVELQEAQIGQKDLDFLVNIHIWDTEYEFANFTDDELLDAITGLASGTLAADVEPSAWKEETRRKLHAARQQHQNIATVIGPLQIKKTALAEVIWPVLLAKFERELTEETVKTPVFKVVLEVQRLVGRLSSGSYMLPSVGEEDVP